LIGPGERYDIELDADNPGVWMVHCHIESHAANGMMTVLEYEGSEPTGPLKEVWNSPVGVDTDDPATEMAGHDSHGMHSDPLTPAEPSVETTPSPEPSDQPAANTAEVVMLDDRFEPRELTVPAGTTVVWVNKGADWHSVAATDASYQSGQIASGSSFSVTFDEPGTYSYICKHHARQGMLGKIVVT
jgi:plastocyanin